MGIKRKIRRERERDRLVILIAKEYVNGVYTVTSDFPHAVNERDPFHGAALDELHTFEGFRGKSLPTSHQLRHTCAARRESDLLV
jgi:hypothetical protein